MSQAKPVQLKTNTSGQIFAKIKNGNLYQLNHKTTPEQAPKVISRIEKAGKINLKHWSRAEKREPLPADQSLLSEDNIRPLQKYNQIWNERCAQAARDGNQDKLQSMIQRKKAKLKALNAQLDAKTKSGEVTEQYMSELAHLASIRDIVECEMASAVEWAHDLAIEMRAAS